MKVRRIQSILSGAVSDRFLGCLRFPPIEIESREHLAREPVIGGERFVKRVISDRGQGGIPDGTIHLPESWRFESKIEWHYGWVEYPLSVSSQAENPANAEAYFGCPLLRLESTEVAPALRQYDRNNNKFEPGDRMPTGAIGLPPRPPLQALALFIQKVRGDVPKFQWIGKQDLPNLAKVLDPSKDEAGNRQHMSAAQ